MEPRQSNVRGKLGEVRAEQYLGEKGYEILARNVVSRGAEIDLIARDDRCIVFVEVKTRKLGGWQSPYDSITEQKKNALRKGAMAYRAIHRTPLEIEFDLIAVIIDDHNHHTIEYTKNIL